MVHPATGRVDTAIEPFDVALLLSPVKGSLFGATTAPLAAKGGFSQYATGLGFTRLYRAVGEKELDDVLKFADYGLSPHYGGKYFAFSEEGMKQFANSSINSGKRITFTYIDVPTTSLNKGSRFFDPKGGGNSIHFADDVLIELYPRSKPVKIIDAPWIPSVRRASPQTFPSN